MKLYISKDKIETFCGNVFSLRLVSDEDISKKDINWESDGDAVSIRDFKGEDKDCFNHGILLTAVNEGECTVKAELDGRTYECRVKVHQMRTFAPSQCINHYVGDFHDHTSLNHNPAEFAVRTDTRASDMVKQLNDEGKLEFAVVSDHACLVPKDDFFAGFVAAEECADDGLIVFAGTESEVTDIRTDRFGHTHKESGEIVTVNANNYAAVKTFDEYYEKLSDSPFAIASFAHPQVIGWDMNGIWNFRFDRNCVPELMNKIRLIETGNGSKTSESNMINEYMYSLALDYGFKVSPACNSDHHGPVWSYDMWEGKTVILAPEKSKEAFLDALRNCRTYATESGSVKLYYTVNGRCPSETLDETSVYYFHVETGTLPYGKYTPIVRLEVISDGGETVYMSENKDYGSFDFTVESNSARYFYLKLTDSNNYYTWSSPVWTGRAFDKPSDKGIPVYIDKSEFTAVDSCGNACPEIINGNPKIPWISGKEKPCVTVDMKQLYTVKGIGYTNHHFVRPECNDEYPATKRIAEFVSEYKVLSSVDGISYTPCAKGCIRAFGGETEIYFDRPCKARFIRFEAVETVGSKSGDKKYTGIPAVLGEISVFE